MAELWRSGAFWSGETGSGKLVALWGCFGGLRGSCLIGLRSEKCLSKVSGRRGEWV